MRTFRAVYSLVIDMPETVYANEREVTQLINDALAKHYGTRTHVHSLNPISEVEVKS